MAKTFEEILSDKISDRLAELDELKGLWLKEPTLRLTLDPLFIVRCYAHLEGGIKESVNYFISVHATKSADLLKPSYLLWRERSAILEVLSSVDVFNPVALDAAITSKMQSKSIRQLSVYHEYNQMRSDNIMEIYNGLTLSWSQSSTGELIVNDLVRKRNMIAHGSGILSPLDVVQLNQYKDAVESILTDLWVQLCGIYPDGLRK